MQWLDARADGHLLNLAVGEVISIRLEENPTTGYRWRVDSSGAPALALDLDNYEASPGGATGSPGHHVWRFRAVTAQTATIRLSYQRRAGAPARTFTLVVEIR